MNFIKRIILTNNGVIYKVAEPEVSNRVLRKYQKHVDFFIRVKCQDDQVSNYITKIFFQRAFDDFRILDREYDFLAYSNSQLRSSSCWFLLKQDAISRDAVIESLGDFSSIDVPAKRAARIGLNFASSTPFVSPEPLAIKVMPDDRAPDGQDYTDGIGKISTYTLGLIQKQLRISGHVSAI